MFTDTHGTVKRLEKAGFSVEQAEALAEEHEEMAQEIVRNIREALRAEIAPEFAAMRAEMRAEIQGVRAEIQGVARDQLFKFIALILGTGAFVLAAVVFAVSRMV